MNQFEGHTQTNKMRKQTRKSIFFYVNIMKVILKLPLASGRPQWDYEGKLMDVASQCLSVLLKYVEYSIKYGQQDTV